MTNKNRGNWTEKDDERLREARFIDATEGAPQRIEASDLIESRL